MFRGGGYRGRGRGGNNRGNGRARTQAKGLFSDGIWHCDCDPRLPAEHFKVKKEGKNQGRWFYTCQKQDRCGFFLWDDDAKPREEAAVLNGSRTEPVGQEGWNAGRSNQAAEQQQQVQGQGLFTGAGRQRSRVVDDEETASEASPPPEYTAFVPTPSGSKRSAEEAELNDDDEFGWALGEQADALERKASGGVMETPQKAQKTGVYATPATTAKRKLPWLDDPMTPATAKRNETTDYFQTPSKAPADPRSSNQPQTPHAPPTTSTSNRTPSPPARQRDALNNPADSSSSLTSELLACLNQSNTRIPPDIISSVRSIATKHDLKTQGIVKGRDISRLAIKAKDAKIAELQARIASLEAEREVERGVLRMRRWERENAGGEGER